MKQILDLVGSVNISNVDNGYIVPGIIKYVGACYNFGVPVMVLIYDLRELVLCVVVFGNNYRRHTAINDIGI